MQMLVNGKRNALSCKKTGEVWAEVTKAVTLKEGANSVVIKYASTINNVFLDCIKVSRADANVYTFEDDTAGEAATTPAATLLTALSGEAGVMAEASGNHALRTYSAQGEALLEMFRSDATDYSVTWQLLEGSAGVLMRGSYLFMPAEDKVTLSKVQKSDDGQGESLVQLAQVERGAGQQWFRATAMGSQLYLETSADGETWTMALQGEDNDSPVGDTRLRWTSEAIVDNIAQWYSGITLSATELGDITQTYMKTPEVISWIDVNGADLTENIKITSSSDMFELSLDSTENFCSSIELDKSVFAEESAAQRVYIRLRTDARIGDYTTVLRVASGFLEPREVTLNGSVTPPVYSTRYDFEDDKVLTVASNPPAQGVTRGTANSCTAGVATYADNTGSVSNVLRIYSAPSNNGTGVLNLDRFTRKSSDYSVTWRQVLTGSGDYKNGVVLRGDTATVGTSSKGYTQGMMAGYYLNVYNTGSSTQFRVYKSTAATSLNMINNTTVSLAVAQGQSMWYRASVQGSARVTIKIEYSTDGVNWQQGTKMTDEGGSFQQGATQFVWGLAANKSNFVIDDIVYEGVTYDEGVITDAPVVTGVAAQVVRTEYYDTTGRRLLRPEDACGSIVIERSYMSDRSLKVRKYLVR